MEYPALKLVARQDYLDENQVLPHSEEVRRTVLRILDESGWGSEQIVQDVRRDSVKIQHEVPPNEPVEAIGVVVVLGQIATDMRTVDGVKTDPLDELLTGLYNQYNDEIEVWIGTAKIA